jgi:hypothetical protein
MIAQEEPQIGHLVLPDLAGLKAQQPACVMAAEYRA